MHAKHLEVTHFSRNYATAEEEENLRLLRHNKTNKRKPFDKRIVTQSSFAQRNLHILDVRSFDEWKNCMRQNKRYEYISVNYKLSDAVFLQSYLDCIKK
jgi:hypothetical protein